MSTPAGAARQRMVDQIKTAGHARSVTVETVMRSVPRHRFVPGATVEDAYADIAVITKRAEDGAALSCASVPTVVAMMLDQLDVRPGSRVLEIGAGTGYNAALLAELTGPSGRVTTVDIDPEVTAGAQRNLNVNGYEQVDVITRDGALGAAEHAPYDRIVFTVGSWDLPQTIWRQLKPGGRLVVPLRWRGQTRSVAFDFDDEHLQSDSVELCGFVPMIGQEGELNGPIDRDGRVSLYWDLDQSIDARALEGMLELPKREAWTGVVVGPMDSFDGIWLRMTATESNVCRIAADPAAVKSGLCTPAIPSRSPAIADGDSLSYLTIRRLDGDEPRFELGAVEHGPGGGQLSDRLCEDIRRWDGARDAVPTITAYPIDRAPDSSLASVLRKQECALEVTPAGSVGRG